MRALTLWPEWAWAVMWLGKPIENRTWQPSEKQLAPGQRLAIHAGARLGGSSGGASAWFQLQAILNIRSMAERAGWTCRIDSRQEGKRVIARFQRDNVTHTFVPASIPKGALVGSVVYGGVVPPEPVDWPATGWEVPGAKHWRITDPVRLRLPIRFTGERGLFSVPPRFVEELGGELRPPDVHRARLKRP